MLVLITMEANADRKVDELVDSSNEEEDEDSLDPRIQVFYG